MIKYESSYSQGNHIVRHTNIKIDTINIEITNIYNSFFLQQLTFRVIYMQMYQVRYCVFHFYALPLFQAKLQTPF